MEETKFLMNLIECLNFPFETSEVDYLDDADDVLTVVMKDGRKFTFAIEDVRQTILLNAVLNLLPFKIEEMEGAEENCGTVWITLKTGKVYALSLIETEPEQLQIDLK